MRVFAEEWDGAPFELFGREHLLALTLVVVVQVVLLWRFARADAAARRSARWALTAALWGQEVAFHLWRASLGTWNAREMLPLHLCSQGVWLGGLMLLTRSRRLYEYVYFAALAGAAMALATPDAGRYGWPHFRFTQFFVSHGLIVTAPLWMTFVEGFRPTASAPWRAAAVTVATGLATVPLNLRLGSNYMFSARRPASASVLDHLPPWPRSLPMMGGLVVAAYAALYLPWVVRDAVAEHRRRP